MKKIIRVDDVSLFNESHAGLFFEDGSNIKTYCENIGVYHYHKTPLYVNKKAKRVNLLEKYDCYGDCKMEIIDNNNIESALIKIEYDMMNISSRTNERNCDVTLCKTTNQLMDGSIVYEHWYKSVKDGENDITRMFFGNINLIINAPIINAKN